MLKVFCLASAPGSFANLADVLSALSGYAFDSWILTAKLAENVRKDRRDDTKIDLSHSWRWTRPRRLASRDRAWQALECCSEELLERACPA